MIWAQPGDARCCTTGGLLRLTTRNSRLGHRISGPTLPAGRAAPAPAFWMPPRALRAPCFCSTACALCCCCCWSTLPLAPGFCCSCFWPALLPPFADWTGAFLPAACCPPAFLAPAPATGFFLAFLIRSSSDRSSRGLLAMLAGGCCFAAVVVLSSAREEGPQRQSNHTGNKIVGMIEGRGRRRVCSRPQQVFGCFHLSAPSYIHATPDHCMLCMWKECGSSKVSQIYC